MTEEIKSLIERKSYLIPLSMLTENDRSAIKVMHEENKHLPNALVMLEEMACALVHADKAWAGDEESATMAQSALARYEAFKADVTAKAGG